MLKKEKFLMNEYWYLDRITATKEQLDQIKAALLKRIFSEKRAEKYKRKK